MTTPPTFTPDQKAFLRKQIQESVTVVENIPAHSFQLKIMDKDVGTKWQSRFFVNDARDMVIRRLYRQIGVGK